VGWLAEINFLARFQCEQHTAIAAAVKFDCEVKELGGK